MSTPMSQHPSPTPKLKALQRVYEISVSTRNFEITQLTNRNNYY